MKKVNVKITFLEGILGTSSADPEIYTRFIGAKAPDAVSVEEEVEALGAESIVERGTTVFPRDDDGTPFLYDYQIKGFFKDACAMLARLSEKDPETGKKKKAKNESGKLTAYKKVIDGLVFVEPRKIHLESPGPVTICGIGQWRNSGKGRFTWEVLD